MTEVVAPRSPEQRKREALDRLTREVAAWVGTADASGVPCLVPLNFWWDGETVWLSTRATNPTGANLIASGLVRLCFGHTFDLVLVEGTARTLTREELPTEVGDAFAAKGGWDPRDDHPSYLFFQVTPEVLQAWGTVAEMPDRTLMRDGAWLV
jgi:hypothetical protein